MREKRINQAQKIGCLKFKTANLVDHSTRRNICCFAVEPQRQPSTETAIFHGQSFTDWNTLEWIVDDSIVCAEIVERLKSSLLFSPVSQLEQQISVLSPFSILRL